MSNTSKTEKVLVTGLILLGAASLMRFLGIDAELFEINDEPRTASETLNLLGVLVGVIGVFAFLGKKREQ